MWKRNIYWLPPVCATTEDQTYNLGMCPDQESNPWPLGLQDDAQPTEPHWPGPDSHIKQTNK